jgi:hypothetical protein
MSFVQAIDVEVPLEEPKWEKYGGYTSAHKSSGSLLWHIHSRQFIPTPIFQGNEMACRFHRWLDVKLGWEEAEPIWEKPLKANVDWNALYYEFMATPLMVKMTFAEPEFETSVDDDDGTVYHHDKTFRKHDKDYNDIPPNDSRTFMVEVILIPLDAKYSKHPIISKFSITKKQETSLPKYAKIGIEETLRTDECWMEYHLLSGSTAWNDSIRKPISEDSYKQKVVTSVAVEIVSPEWATEKAAKDDLTY